MSETKVAPKQLRPTPAFSGTSSMNTTSASQSHMTCTEQFDTTSNFDGTYFTAPYDGIYHFDAGAGFDDNGGTNARVYAYLYAGTSGSETVVARSVNFYVGAAPSTYDGSTNVSIAVELAAGQRAYVDVYQQNWGTPKVLVAEASYFSGHLVTPT